MFPSESKIHVEKLKTVYLYIRYYCRRHLFCPQSELAMKRRDFKLVILK